MTEDRFLVKPWPAPDPEPWAVAFNEGYDDYNGVTQQANPYPPNSGLSRWWEMGYRLARQHDQERFEVGLEP